MACEIRGFLEPHYEQGSPDIIWSLLDPCVPSHFGLHMLTDGDELDVRLPAGSRSFSIKLDTQRNYGPMGAYRSLQAGCDPDEWIEMFTSRRRAILRSRGKPSCLHGPAATLSVRLDKAGDETLYRALLSGWLHWLQDGSVIRPFGMHKTLGLSVESAVRFVGLPIEAAKADFHLADLPLDRKIFERVALMHSLAGHMHWHLGSDNASAFDVWIRNYRVEGRSFFKWLDEGEDGWKRICPEMIRMCDYFEFESS